jgi:hypothetical protein
LTKNKETPSEKYTGFSVYRLEKFFKTKNEARDYINNQDDGYFAVFRDTFWGASFDKK